MDKSSDFESVLFLQSFHGIVCYDAQFRLLRTNPALAQLLGLAALPEVGVSVFSFLPEDKLLKAALQNALTGHQVQLRNLAYRIPNGKNRLFLDANIAAWPHPSEALRRGILLLKESSEANSREKSLSRKRPKDALKAFDFSNDRLKCIINSTEDLIVAIDPNFRVTLFNEHFKKSYEAQTGRPFIWG
ncbi:MAG: hypothetical protein HC913_21810 [Microscillaceae bacterium]|nr:hypothetical protein [Microscillaceae bacterium]